MSARRMSARLAGALVATVVVAMVGAGPAAAATPVATNQSVSVPAGQATLFSLDAVDDDGDLLTVVNLSGPSHGTLTAPACADLSCEYTSTPGFSGTDSFTYQVTDGTTTSGTATVTITVLPQTVTTVTSNAAGALALGQSMVAVGSTLTGASFPLVPPDGTPNGTSTALDEFPTAGPSFGILTSGDASLADDPNDSTGTGASDNGVGRGSSDLDTTVLKLDLTAPVGVNCIRFDFEFYSDEFPEYVGSGFNDGFVAELDATTWTTSASEITAPDNFAFDSDGHVLSINSTGAALMNQANAGPTTYDGATTLLRAGHQVTAGPHSLYLSIFDQGDSALDSAAFVDNIRFVTVADPATQCAAGAVVPTNDPPVAVDDNLTTAQGSAGNVSVLANDSDPDGDPLTVTGKTDGAHGTVNCTAAGVCTYTPAAGFSGIDTFTYTISDGHSHTATATVHVTVTATGVNHVPVAVGDSLSTAEDTAGSKSVLANDTDSDGDVLTVSGKTDGAHGTVSCTAAGVCTYTPAANYNGPDSFTYTISDGHGGTATGTVTVTVTPVNDPPVADDETLTTAEDVASQVSVLPGDTDADGDTLTVTGKTDGAHGTVSCTTAGVCTYTPAANYIGPDSFTYTVSDGHGGTATGTVGVTVTATPSPNTGNLSVLKIESADPIPVGNTFSYRLVVSATNATPVSAATVTDPLPSGFLLHTVTTSAGTCTTTSHTVTCTVGTVTAGSPVTVTINGAFVTAGTLANTAQVSAPSDTSAADNHASASTTVTGKTCTIVGTFGPDIINGTNKADVICGLAGDDRINGKLGNDTLYGNEGNDRLNGLGGNDLIDGGPGTDTTTYATALQGVRVNLGLHKATGQGVDTLISIENVLGSNHNDTITGNAAPNTLWGGKGADLLRGLAGNDTLNGGTGPDTCKQGTGKGHQTSC